MRGQVVDAASGLPIRDVELSLQDLHWEQAAEPVMPDSQGRFVFAGLAAGEYILSADSPRTGHVSYDELPDSGFVQTIRIKPEDREKSVVFRIVPRVAIEGMVRDELGDPVERALVTVNRPAWVNGRIVLQQVTAGNTDDRGRFRLGRLPPGGYVVCAAGQNGQIVPTASAGGPVDFQTRPIPRFYTQTCYPDAGGSRPAVFELHDGKQTEVDLTLGSAPAVSVKGHILNLPPATGVSVRLVRDSGFLPEQPLFAGTGQDGAFTFQGAPPGHYRLIAISSWQEPDGKGKSLMAQTSLDVGATNVEGIEVPLEPGAVIDVVLHGAAGERVPPESVQVGLRPAGSSTEYTQWARPDPPPSFRFTFLPAGTYTLVTRTNFAESTCIESATIGDQDVRHSLVTVTPGMTAKMDVTVSKVCGEIEARAVRDGQPVPDAKVVLLLSGSAKQPEDLLTDFANDEGEIRFTGLAAGRYRLWAWRVDNFGAFVGPAELAAAEQQSAVVEVPKGKHVTIDVPLLRSEGGSR